MRKKVFLIILLMFFMSSCFEDCPPTVPENEEEEEFIEFGDIDAHYYRVATDISEGSDVVRIFMSWMNYHFTELSNTLYKIIKMRGCNKQIIFNSQKNSCFTITSIAIYLNNV